MAVEALPLLAAEEAGPEVIAARFEVEAVLGRGGMGTVHRVRDLHDGRRLALKRLTLARGSRSTLLALFEREYATLSELSHPCIIRVHDYGYDADAAYYTMELLDGQELNALAPLPYSQACRHVRDVATSLALLHMRRLVHRDVSPRNVQLTSEGVCKLLDFGALVGFGESSEVVGTPPCVPPEALDGEGLDQRADLYALGCLAYFLLTGRHAYPASHIGQLPSYWAQPLQPPSVAKPEHDRTGASLPAIPKQLDELVLRLLRADRSARPDSASVVIDHLNAILGDEPRDERRLAEHHLASAPLVGCEDELDDAGRLLDQLRRGRGRSLLVQASRGAGKSRLLRQLALRGRLQALPVVQLDAAEHERDFSCAVALCRELLRQLPAIATPIAQAVTALAELLPELAAKGRGAEPANETAPVNAREDTAWHGHAQNALRDFVIQVAAQRPLVLVIDNLQRCDPASAVFIATLGQETRRHALGLFSSLESDAEMLAPAACDALRHASSVHALAGLTEPMLRGWLEALFGDANNLPRLASAVHNHTAGHTGQTLALLRQLLHAGELRFAQGTWSLPLEPAAAIVAHGGENGARRRIAELSEGARALARALSLYRGALTVEACRALGKETDGSRAREQLDELVRHQLLSHSLRVYAFIDERVRRALAEEISGSERARVRQRIAELILARPAPRVAERLEAGLYLLEANDPRGSKLLSQGAIEISTKTPPHTACIEPLERAIALGAASALGKAERAVLLGALAAASYVLDRRLARYSESFLDSFRELLSLSLARRLRPWLGARLSLGVALGIALLRYLVLPQGAKPCGFPMLVELFISGAVSLCGRAAICLDRPGIERIVDAIEPLRAFGRDHEIGFAHDFCRGLAMLTQERLSETHAHWRELEARMLRPGSFPRLSSEARQLWSGGVSYVLGIFDTFAGDPNALVRAKALEATEVELNLLAAAQLRRQYHGFRGEADQVLHAQAEVEACALRTGSAWQAETFSAILTNYCASLWHDLLTSKRALDETEAIAPEVPSLERYVASSRAVYMLARAKPQECIALYEAMFAQEKPLERIGSSASTGLLAEAYNQVGEHARALELCDTQLSRLDPGDQRYVHLMLPLHVSRLAALAALGQQPLAERELDALIARHQAEPSPLVLGSLHELAARLTWQRRDRRRYSKHLKAVEDLFCPLGNSALIARYTALTALSGSEGGMSAKIATMREVRAFESALSQLHDRERLTHHIFAWLMQKCDGFSGWLVVQEQGLLVSMVSTQATPPLPEALDMVQRSLVSLAQDAVTTHIPQPQHDTHVERPALRRELKDRSGEGLHVHLLSYVEDGRFFGEGALLLLGPVGKPPRIRYDLLQVAARHLQRVRPRASRAPTQPPSGDQPVWPDISVHP